MVRVKDYVNIYQNEAGIDKRGMNFLRTKEIDEIDEINGNCDIMRWENV